jgi:DNA-binding NarL/FixJ family response regulator
MDEEHSSPIRILLTDDHAAFRENVGLFLGTESDMQVVAEAANGREALEEYRKHRPDVTVMDLQMGTMNGVDAITSIRSEFPEARIIVLTTYPGDVRVVRAFRAGARGYVLKGMLHRELVETIRGVHAGEKRIPPDVAATIAEDAAGDS